MLSRSGGPVYTYQFEYPSLQPNVGACHCFDIPFWLGNFAESSKGPMLSETNMAKAGSLSFLMQQYLLNFLESGSPNCAELPVWEQCRNGEIQTIHLGEFVSCSGEDDFDNS